MAKSIVTQLAPLGAKIPQFDSSEPQQVKDVTASDGRQLTRRKFMTGMATLSAISALAVLPKFKESVDPGPTWGVRDDLEQLKYTLRVFEEEAVKVRARIAQLEGNAAVLPEFAQTEADSVQTAPGKGQDEVHWLLDYADMLNDKLSEALSRLGELQRESLPPDLFSVLTACYFVRCRVFELMHTSFAWQMGQASEEQFLDKLAEAKGYDLLVPIGALSHGKYFKALGRLYLLTEAKKEEGQIIQEWAEAWEAHHENPSKEAHNRLDETYQNLIKALEA